MSELTELEWSILDSLSDDKETVALILSMIKDDFPDITTRKLSENVYRLYQRGLILEDNHKTVELQTLLDESDDYIDNVYRWGLTELGCEYWERYAPTYYGEPVDWSNWYTGYRDFIRKEGYIDGVSLEVCLQGLESVDTDKDWQVERSTLAYSQLEGFRAKYYKYIPGGYRITYKLKKRTSN